jgi:hypothetical protein
VEHWKDMYSCIRPWRPKFGPEGKHFISGLFFLGGGMQRSCDAGGARSAPFGTDEPKKTGARSGRARMRGHNPLVFE